VFKINLFSQFFTVGTKQVYETQKIGFENWKEVHNDPNSNW